ncbi:hypothetical protein ACHAWC_001038, partial [Mediolabrus comicus]
MSKPVKTPPTPRYTSIFCEFMAHYHQRPTVYPKDHVFEENELLPITPSDICRWMNVKAFGTADPDDNAPLVGSSWSSLGFMKKSISFFLPRNAPWDPVEGRGNPTKSEEVKSLLLRVKTIEDSRKKASSGRQHSIYGAVDEIVTAINSADGARGLLQKIQGRNDEYINMMETMGTSLSALGATIEEMKAKLTASNDAIKQELSKDSTGLDDGHYKTFISELPTVSGLAKTISDEVANVSESLQSFVNSPGVGMPHEITINPGVSGYCSFTEDGKIWDIPAGFIFPQCDLFTAWKHWLIGFPDHKIRNNKNEIVAAPIKPLRLISLGNVHQSAKKKMKDGWRPILIFMQAELEQDLDDMPLPSIDEQFIKMTYDTAMAALQSKAPNLMSGKNEQKHQSWKVATWSRKIREEQLGPTQHRNI